MKQLKEIKKYCNIISLVWLFILAFMSQVCIANEAMGDMYSLFLALIAVMQVIGR